MKKRCSIKLIQEDISAPLLRWHTMSREARNNHAIIHAHKGSVPLCWNGYIEDELCQLKLTVIPLICTV